MKTININFIKIPPEVLEVKHADRQMDKPTESQIDRISAIFIPPSSWK
jgi:hypothetical protein